MPSKFNFTKTISLNYGVQTQRKMRRDSIERKNRDSVYNRSSLEYPQKKRCVQIKTK